MRKIYRSASEFVTEPVPYSSVFRVPYCTLIDDDEKRSKYADGTINGLI